MSNPNPTEPLLKMIQQCSRNRPVLVAIDGHSAAGKSTLAQKIADEFLDLEVITTDDFYRPIPNDLRYRLNAKEGYEHYYDWQRLREDVLQPLSNQKAARFQLYDWQYNELGRQRTVPPRDFIIVEGCYSARPELAIYYDIIVLVETSPKERMKRQRQRNDATQEWLMRWDRAETYYIRTTNLRERADIILRGEG